MYNNGRRGKQYLQTKLVTWIKSKRISLDPGRLEKSFDE